MNTQFVSRAYNKFVHNTLWGTVTKESDTTRLKNEISYYLSIPEKYRILYPRVLAYNDEKTWFTIEKYGYPDLGSIMVGGPAQRMKEYINKWSTVFNHLRYIIEEFRKETNAPLKYDDCVYMYVRKTEQEHKSFVEQQRWEDLFKYPSLTINNKNYKSFWELWPHVRHYIESEIIPEYHPTLIHGDMCLSNILYGGQGILKFIDPRGSFGNLTTHGDYRYDIAKLSHSVNGGYEFFNTGLFTSKWEGQNNWSYNYLGSTRHKNNAKMAFNDIFFHDNNKLKKQILAIEGLIFIGSVARHYENIDRQLALYLVGIEKLHEAMEL